MQVEDSANLGFSGGVSEICRPGAMLTSDCGPGNDLLSYIFNRYKERERGQGTTTEAAYLKISSYSHSLSRTTPHKN
jgi:hypothetical protein